MQPVVRKHLLPVRSADDLGPWHQVCVCVCVAVCTVRVCCSCLQELRNAYSEEIMGIRREEEMEMSDDDSEENPCKRMRTGENGGRSLSLCSP